MTKVEEKDKRYAEKVLREHYKKIGQKGGRATVDKYGRKYMKELSAKALRVRWGKNEKVEESDENNNDN